MIGHCLNPERPPKKKRGTTNQNKIKMVTLKQVRQALLSHEKHYQLALSGKLSNPYNFVIGEPPHVLCYFGGKHTTNINHPQFTKIKDWWSKWLKITNKTSRLAVVEGRLQGKFSNKNEAIKLGGEGGYLSYLADTKQVKIASFEPKRKWIEKQLLTRFDRDEIQFQYLACMAWQCLENYSWESIENCLKNYLNTCAKTSAWSNYDFSLKHMNSLCAKITGKEINQHNSNSWNDLINPFNKRSPLIKISTTELELRDTYIVKKLIKKYQQKISLFVLYSYQHAYRQKPALTKFCQVNARLK